MTLHGLRTAQKDQGNTMQYFGKDQDVNNIGSAITFGLYINTVAMEAIVRKKDRGKINRFLINRKVWLVCMILGMCCISIYAIAYVWVITSTTFRAM